jgi:hypothetical protein
VTALRSMSTIPIRLTYYRKVIAEAASRPIFMVDWRQRNATFFRRAAGRAQCDVPDPHPDRSGGGAQYRVRADHAGEGQGSAIAILRTMGVRKARSRASFSSPALRSAWLASFVGSCSPAGVSQYRVDPPVPVLVHRDHPVRIRRSISCRACLPMWTSGKPPPWS